MRRYRLCFIMFLSLLLAVMLAPQSVSASETRTKVRVGYFIHDGYQNKSDDGTYSGYGYDYLQKIAQYSNLQYEYVEGSWAQCLTWLEDGTIDMMGFMLKTSEREAIYDYTDWDCGYNSSKLLTLKDNTTMAEDAWEDFNGITVGLNRGSQVVQQFEAMAAEQGFTYHEKLYDGQSAVNDALKNKEVDAICVSDVVVPDWMRTLAVFNPQPIYYAVTKGNTALLDKLNYALGEIKSLEPTFEQSLRSKYYTDTRSQSVVFSKKEKEYIADAPPIQVAIDPDYLPIEGYDSETGQASGFTPSLLAKISELSGLKFEYEKTDSYEDEVNRFDAGSCDILSSINQSFSNADRYQLSDIWLKASVVLVGSSGYQTDMTRPVKIAVIPRTTFLESYASTLYPGCEFVSMNSLPQTLAEVEDGAVDLAMINVYSFQSATVASDKGLNIIHDTGYLSEYRFAFHQDASAELVSIINKCIGSISESESNDMLTGAIMSSVEVKSNAWEILLLSLAAAALLTVAVIFFVRLRSSRKHLVRLAYYDALTGIGNLAKFTKDAGEIIRQNPKTPFVIRVFDIRNFQMFNDFNGFEKGNALLCDVATSMREIMDSKTETIGHAGADEFLTLTTDTTETAYALRRREFRKRFNLKGKAENYSRIIFKTGSCLVEGGDDNVEEALEKARLAHKEARKSDKNNYVVYDEKMKNEAKRVRAIEDEMEEALSGHEFKLYLQPQYGLTDNAVVGVEALARWQKKDGTLVGPGDFIPVFEKNGFIIRLDYYMFGEACRIIRQWLDSGIAVKTVSVNLSRLHLRNANLVPELCAIADRYQVPHGLLELELTESIAADNEQAISDLVKKLHEVGMRFSVDDFGSGYSSLGILHMNDFDTLKLDRSFFTSRENSRRSRVIIESVISMAHSLKIKTIAEGAEEAYQIDFLRKMNCDAVQSFYYARPMPADAFTQEMENQKITQNLPG